ncbi:trypsin-2 [Calliopsis andreniformis]|uniref:trypsin-2 n=1 Tax=Calliopsis andreniformis TaxID=337506 RepID=UPI003FCD2C47
MRDALGDTSVSVPPNEETEWINYGLNGRIVNGTVAALRQFPHQVSLRRSYNSRHFCGGSLIHEKYVVTAAHCMYLNGGTILPWTIMVVAGELQLNKDTSTGQRKGVDAITIHEKFNLQTLQNDIALLTLKAPFKFTLEIKPAPLSTHPPIPNTMCQVAGWGYPSDDFPVLNNDLMYVDLPILKQDMCKKLLVNITDMPAGMFCAGYLEGMKDACQGDSGGGMVCNGILTGVVSGGAGCALPEIPGVYSDIFYYKKWLATKMNVNLEVETILPNTPSSSSSGAEKTFQVSSRRK